MNLKRVIVCLAIGVLACCSPRRLMETKSCYSAENFEIVKKYIAYRILHSSSGTHFYLEFPESQEPQDGIKRPSKHPENVYNIRFEQARNEIVFKNGTVEHSFLADAGLLAKKNSTENDQATAHAIFCHLVALAGKLY
ncbi:MAG: hypothetical protein EAZ95_16520 [Bacteroidetes bacterium]|nr:MAG: hypothetical protein EAZ95_16520 [Bacteroidota bacterium]